MKIRIGTVGVIVVFLLNGGMGGVGGVAWGQPKGFNYDESEVPEFRLPDPLTMLDGKKVTGAEMWLAERRPELLGLFEEYVYGKAPFGRPYNMRFEVTSVDEEALGGTATRKLVTVRFDGREEGPSMEMLIYLPNDVEGPAPVFMGLSFGGNQTIHADPAIPVSTRWMRPKKTGIDGNRATEKSRGTAAQRWPVEDILARGYGLVTIYCGDIDPDFDDGFENGVHAMAGKPGANGWGTISAWAWGLSRGVDYLESDTDVDASKIALLGHSRLGKTALWAGAQDERFAVVISNNSGCGGAALSRRAFGETVERINTSFPHWFNDNFTKYNSNEGELPVDQHMLIALMAPRPVLVCSAEGDQWADPHGEFLSARGAGSVYRMMGESFIGPTDEMPALDKMLMSTVGYKIRPGKHDVLQSDWQYYMDFADHHYKRLGK